MKRNVLFMVAALALLVAACSTDKAVGPKRPTVKDQPQSFIYGQGAEAVPLTVTATTKDKKAKLTYQWYSNKINSAKGGAKVKDATGKLVSGVEGGEFTPPTDTVGVFYYYVTVSSTLHKETAKKTSEVAVITVMDVAAEDMPVINAQNGDGDSDPSATVIGDNLVLKVDVEDSDDPIVSYQWYKNTRNSNVGGTLIPDATSATYIAPTDVEGTMYYYVVITTQSGKTLTSLPIKVTVVLEKPVDPDDPEDPDNPGPPPKVDALTPVILVHPRGAAYYTDDPAEPLTVDAFTNDGTLSYQWYAGGTIIYGAREAEYTPPTDTVGTVSYHVVITNTIYDNGDGGNKTAQATSNAAAIQVRDRVHAQTPVITDHPVSASYDDQYTESTGAALSVTVSVTDGGNPDVSMV